MDEKNHVWTQRLIKLQALVEKEKQQKLQSIFKKIKLLKFQSQIFGWVFLILLHWAVKESFDEQYAFGG